MLLEFWITGPPVSAQARNRMNLRAWQDRIRARATQRLTADTVPAPTEVDVTIVYYFDRPTTIDNDNLAKPVLDALQGIVYVNDRQVRNVSCKRRDLNGRYPVRGMSAVLAEGFVHGTDFLHVKVTTTTFPEDLG